MKKIIESLLPISFFEILEDISIKMLYKFRKVELSELNYRNGKIYYNYKLYTGKTFLKGTYNFSEIFKNSNWTKDINISNDKDEYDNILIGALEFEILQGEVKTRYTYEVESEKILKIIKFNNYYGEETETYYANKNLWVIKKFFNDNPEGYKEEWDNIKRERRLFINGKLKEIEKR